MIESITTNDSNRPLQWLVWQVNLHCPFQCHYCSEFTWGDKKPARFAWDVYSKAADKIIERYQYGHIEFTGGEPSYFPYMEQLIDKFYEAGFTIGVITNLGKNIEVYNKWVKKLLYICASYHANVIKTDKQRELWFTKAKTLAKEILMIVRVLIDPKHWDHCLHVAETLSVEDIWVVEPVRLIQFKENFIINPKTANYLYTVEQNKIVDRLQVREGEKTIPKVVPTKTILKYPDREETYYKLDTFFAVADLARQRQNNFKGWSCDVGIKSIFIEGDGKIARGSCFANDKKFIGSINEIEKVQWPTEATTCPYSVCFCDTDMIISKRKI
jgi:organic radical activating enzyme